MTVFYHVSRSLPREAGGRVRVPGLDEQGVWEKRKKVLVSGRTEMTGKVIRDGLEEGGGGRPGRAWKVC